MTLEKPSIEVTDEHRAFARDWIRHFEEYGTFSADDVTVLAERLAARDASDVSKVVAHATRKLREQLDEAKRVPVGGVLEQAIEAIVAHDAEHPDHGVGCACHDGHAGRIRRLLAAMPEKSRDNLRVVIGYVMRHPL